MKNIIVLTDNIVLYENIKRIINNKEDSSLKFKYFHSPTGSPMANHRDGLKALDINIDSGWLLSICDLLISAHCLQFFPVEIVKNIRCINIHPGFNPVNRGWYPQVFSIINGTSAGATIHEMDEKLDHGPIIVQEEVPVYEWDTSYSLYKRILQKEIQLLEENFELIINGDYEASSSTSKGNLNTRADFRKLCEINMDQHGTFKDFYNLLRALSHHGYQNAYFYTDNGDKVLIELKIVLGNK